jgi:hypothetical protein
MLRQILNWASKIKQVINFQNAMAVQAKIDIAIPNGNNRKEERSNKS